MTNNADLEGLVAQAVAVCEARGWSLHWTARGPYDTSPRCDCQQEPSR